MTNLEGGREGKGSLKVSVVLCPAADLFPGYRGTHSLPHPPCRTHPNAAPGLKRTTLPNEHSTWAGVPGTCYLNVSVQELLGESLQGG